MTQTISYRCRVLHVARVSGVKGGHWLSLYGGPYSEGTLPPAP
jgi:hypothetical protein